MEFEIYILGHKKSKTSKAMRWTDDLVSTSKAKTVKVDSKNINSERGILNGPFAWDFMILFSYYRFE
jgi:hypothetical protein